jgi:hypothetical protein
MLDGYLIGGCLIRVHLIGVYLMSVHLMGVCVIGAYLILLSGKSYCMYVYTYNTFLPPRGLLPNTLGTPGGLNYSMRRYTKLILGVLP